MRRIRISVCAGLALAMLVCAAQSDFESLVKEAVAKQQAGHNADAAELYRAALKLAPNDVATRVNLGVVLAQLGRYDEAIAQYRAAETALPGDARIERNIGLAQEKGGRVGEARDTFERLHQAAPDDPQTALLLADAELRLHHDQRVIELVRPLAAAQSGDAGWAYLLGVALFDTGDAPGAVKELGIAAQADPTPAGLQAIYGQALLMTGDPQAADAAFAKELQVNPKDYAANLGRAQIATARGQFDEACSFAKSALALRADATDAQLAMAECLAGERRYGEARPLAEAAAALDSEEAHETLADVYRGLHLDARARREGEKAAALRAASDPGPPVGQPAPEFSLGGVGLRELRADEPVVLLFGSYSCPNFRDAAPALKALYAKYGARAHFLLVYVREAHAGEGWQSGRNEREGVALTPASNMAEKEQHTRLCSRQLHLTFPAVTDGMDGAVEQAYRAWPSRVFVVAQNGRVLYSSRLTAFEFRPQEMDRVLSESVRSGKQ